jgi:3-isopropylmalate dehydrogenase
MTRFTVAVLPGDGIGPEVTAEAVRVLAAVAETYGFGLETPEYPIGAAAVFELGAPLPPRTRDAVLQADAVLLGAVGHPSLADAAPERRPETGLLALRQLLGAYANLRPVTVYQSLRAISPLRPERLDGVSLLIVRELTGGLYYGEPRSRTPLEAVNTLRYSAAEIERVARVAFQAARERRRLVTSVDKANVLEASQLWRECVNRVSTEYPEVRLEHLYVDVAAMRLVAAPASVDVLLTENMFGDILSDEAAVLAGSLGLLPSASLGDGPGLFEPVHGSAPDIAGRRVANPIGAIASAALLLRYGLQMPDAAELLERAISAAISDGVRTPDLAAPGEPTVTTCDLTDAVLRRLGRAAPLESSGSPV